MQNSLVTEIATALRKEILTNTLRGGEKLKQDHLADKFHASHVPIREALQLLVAEGLAEHIPRRGVVVKAISLADVIEVVDLRTELETLALRISFPHLTSTHFKEAEKYLTLSQNNQNDLDLLIEYNWQFHRSLYYAVEKPRLQSILEELWLHAERYMRLVWSCANYNPTSHREHEEILTLCQQGKCKETEKCLRKHIQSAGTVFEKMLTDLA